MTGRKPQRGRDGVCKYPTLEDVVEEAGLKEVENYVSHLQNTVAHFIATRPIMDLCLATKRRLGSRVAKRWWE